MANSKDENKNSENFGPTISKSEVREIIKLLQKMEMWLRELEGLKKFPYDEKGSAALPKGRTHTYKYHNYYDVSNTIKTAGPINPNDFDSPVYNTERIFENLERYADIIEVSNDGTDTLFALVSHGGRTNFSQEVPIYTGETKTYYNVYELRLRSPTVGLPYRVTEYIIETVGTTILGTVNVSGSSINSTNITPNRSSFTAVVINAPTTGTLLSNITVPNGFALVIRANVNNSGQVFVANSIANATNAAIPGNRITLNAGDVARLFVTNANIVAVAGSIAGQNVDILVEQ